MTTAIRVCLFAFIVLTAGTLVGQDKAEPPKVKGTVPANWGKFGLTDQQKQAVFKIQAEYDVKIVALEKQIRMLKEQERKDMEAVLNDDQKKLLKEIRKLQGDNKDERK